MKLLLTGRPGSGKTTAVERTLELLGRPYSGFITREVRRGEKRTGFEVAAVPDGARGVLATKGKARGRTARVGSYKVLIDEFERVALPAVENALREGILLVIDEIAKMEFQSPRFKELVLETLGGECDLLATVQTKRSSFLERVRSHPGVELVELTRENRDSLPSELAARLGRC